MPNWNQLRGRRVHSISCCMVNIWQLWLNTINPERCNNAMVRACSFAAFEEQITISLITCFAAVMCVNWFEFTYFLQCISQMVYLAHHAKNVKCSKNLQASISDFMTADNVCSTSSVSACQLRILHWFPLCYVTQLQTRQCELRGNCEMDLNKTIHQKVLSTSCCISIHRLKIHWIWLECVNCAENAERTGIKLFSM